MWEEMWENISENPLFIYKIQHLMRWFGTSPATILHRKIYGLSPQVKRIGSDTALFAACAFSRKQRKLLQL